MRNNGRRLMPLAFGTPLPYVPDGAEIINYIESSGTQLLDTGISGGTDVEYSVLFEICNGNTGWAQYFGSSRQEASAPKLMRDTSSGVSTVSWYSTAETENTVSTGTTIIGKIYNAEYKNGVFTLDGVTIANIGSYGFGSNSFCVFGYKPEINLKSKLRLYACKVWKDGTLVRDLIPVKVGSVGYMYDNVSNTLIGNSGTGSFILGGSINGTSEVEYLESNGSQYFALPIYANRSTDAFEITYQQTTAANQVRFLTDNSTVINFYVQGSGKYGLYTTGWANIFNATVGTFKDTVKIDYKNKKFYVNGFVGNSTGNNTSSTSKPLLIFGAYGTNPTMKGKLFGFKFWRNNVMQMDCVPVRKRGKGYLYDKINKKYYGNFGTGSWGIGADTGNISKYTRVDYIQNTNNAYIDTGFIPNQDTKVWFDMQLTADQASNKYPCLFGVRQSANTKSFRISFNQLGNANNSNLYYEVGTSPFVYAPEEDFPYTKDRITGELSKSGLVINEHSFPQPATIADFTSPASLLLLRYVNGNTNIHGADGDSFKGYLYGFKIWDGETLVRDFIPVRNQLNVYGLWDLVEGKFYPSSSATAFNGGNFS